MNFTLDEIKDKELKDLLEKLLMEKPMERIGSDGIEKIKDHSFFNDVEWDNLTEQKAPALRDQK